LRGREIELSLENLSSSIKKKKVGEGEEVTPSSWESSEFPYGKRGRVGREKSAKEIL